MVKNSTVIKKLKYYLGSDLTHMVYEAEALAIVLALHLTCEVKEMRIRLTIGTDNQAVLLGLKNQRPKPSHYLLNKIHDSLKYFQIMQSRMRGIKTKGYRKGKGQTKLQDGTFGWKDWNLKQRCKVTFVWTPGHEGITGKELTDAEAKLAAQGKSNSHSELPPFLCKKILPISISATRQELRKEAKFRWFIEWVASPITNDQRNLISPYPPLTIST